MQAHFDFTCLEQVGLLHWLNTFQGPQGARHQGEWDRADMRDGEIEQIYGYPRAVLAVLAFSNVRTVGPGESTTRDMG